jgi:hypothetical protein
VPALNGEIISTITNETGQPVFVIYEFYDPATRAMRDATQATSTGTRTGALIVDNMTGRTQSITVSNPETGTVKTFSIPSSGSALTAAQLAGIPPPNGPINTIADLAGISPTLT